MNETALHYRSEIKRLYGLFCQGEATENELYAIADEYIQWMAKRKADAPAGSPLKKLRIPKSRQHLIRQIT